MEASEQSKGRKTVCVDLEGREEGLNITLHKLGGISWSTICTTFTSNSILKEFGFTFSGLLRTAWNPLQVLSRYKWWSLDLMYCRNTWVRTSHVIQYWTSVSFWCLGFRQAISLFPLSSLDGWSKYFNWIIIPSLSFLSHCLKMTKQTLPLHVRRLITTVKMWNR